jgi:hypothetical protein
MGNVSRRSSKCVRDGFECALSVDEPAVSRRWFDGPATGDGPADT